MGTRRLLHRALLRRRSGQALLGALIVVGLLGGLAGSLEGLAIEGQLAGSNANNQIGAQAVAEMGLNDAMHVLRNTVNTAFVANLETAQDSRAQGWVTNSGSPCTWSGIQSQLQDMFYHFSSLYPDPVPNQIQTPTPQATASYVALWNTAPGPSGRAAYYTWEALVGIEQVGSPCPSWSDTGVQRSMTFPIATYAFAWVWGPQGNVIGELSQYTPSQTPGYIVMTYPDCPAYFTPRACHLPTSVQVTLPAGELLWEDPNVQAPSEP